MSLRRCATLVFGTSSPTRGRCSFRSPICAAMCATTAPSRKRRPRSPRPTCRSPRCWRWRGAVPKPGARRRCSRWAKSRSGATGRRASGSARTATPRRWITCATPPRRCSTKPACCRTSIRAPWRRRRSRRCARWHRRWASCWNPLRNASWSAACRITVRRTRCRRCGCERWRTPAEPRCRSPPASSSASARRAWNASSRCWPSVASTPNTGMSKRSSCRTSAPSRTRRCATPRNRIWRSCCGPSPSRACCSGRQ